MLINCFVEDFDVRIFIFLLILPILFVSKPGNFLPLVEYLVGLDLLQPHRGGGGTLGWLLSRVCRGQRGQAAACRCRGLSVAMVKSVNLTFH